ncbi:IS4 family transposase [Streptomyces sp. NPDC006195]|uniref:IS4 family transposase n=1 Tax=Streptomyces sp. NPDC006195 TaxID=3154581 RepID=UPI0033A8B0FA
MFAPGHVGELTRIVPFEMVDAALCETGTTQRRLRILPSRVVVYLLLAAALFAEVGYRQVWARLSAGLSGPGGIVVARPSASALAAARRRVGVAPLRALFALLRGPAAGVRGRAGVWWRGRLVTAVDGTIMCCPDTAANLAVYQRSKGNHGGSGYPLIRLLAVVACGTRTVIEVVFGTDRVGETSYAHRLLGGLRAGTILLADRNFAVRAWIIAVADTGADLLVRVKTNRVLPVCARCGDGSYVSRIGPVEVRVITAQITVTTSAGRRTEIYRLITTVLDPDCPAAEIVRLYHERWEIETSFFEIKSSTLGGRVLRARTPAGVEQEIWAVLIGYQALRIAISDALLARPGLDPDRGSFTVALNTARDQIVLAAGVLTDSSQDAGVDLVGVIGQAVLDELMPERRFRTGPRVVKRAISKFVASTAKGRQRGPSLKATISIAISIAIPTAAGP